MQLRLKSLELHGYKTFASKTQFEFSSKITAIVGPNGSGKSNIADSIRWVLGEQSYSLLRGKKTEDMIFTGSELRPRSGMASASITFDNSTGWLPIDFSEVSVTRRAYRDGQNEYLLNGQRVRLRDISELLAESGLAERTYTIIGQGLVDTALGIKPEERRLLFEEAAGISLHRSRREEAIRRLETTRRNLDRVLDILSELQPRLRSLERQARRAQEYEVVRADLKVLLRDWYGYHWNRAQHELIEAHEAVKNQDKRVESARLDLQKVQAQLSEGRNKYQDLRTNLNYWLKELGNYHNQLEDYNRKLAVADERERSFRIQRDNLDMELIQLDEEIAINLDRISTITDEIKTLESQLTEASEQREDEVKIFQKKQAERKMLELKVQEAQSEYSNLINEQVSIKVRLNEFQIQKQKKNEQIDLSKIEVQQKNRELEDVNVELEISQHEFEKKKEIVNQIQSEQNRLRELQGKNQEDLQDTDRALRTLETSVSKLQAEYDVLRQAESSLVGYSNGTRLLLEADRKVNKDGILGALSQMISVPREYELAISAALGDHLDAIIISGNPDEALDLLLEHNSKGVLIPITKIRKESEIILNYPGNEGVFGFAAQQIEAQKEIKSVVQLLLEDVYLVEDRQIAVDLLEWYKEISEREQGSPRDIRIVTLKGEIFTSKGPIIAGYGGLSEQSLLGRARQLNELDKDIKSKASELTEVQAHIQRIEKDQSEISATLDTLAKKAREAAKSEEEAFTKVYLLRQKLETLTQQIQWLQDQSTRLVDEVIGMDTEINTYNKRLEGIDADIHLSQDNLNMSNEILAGFNLDEQVEKVSNWNTVIAVLKKSLEETSTRLSERKSLDQEAIESKEKLIRKLHDLEEDIRLLRGDVTIWKEKERALLEQIDVLRQKVDPAESISQELERTQQVLEVQEQKARQSLSITEQHASQTHITYTRRQDALESLRRRIEEDFGLVNFNYEDDISGPNPLPFEGMVEQLPEIKNLAPETDDTIRRTRAQLLKIGPINPEALAEYQEVTDRFNFLTEQVRDLENAENDIRKVIQELDLLMQKEFLHTFEAVDGEFRSIFGRLFQGGSAKLILANPENLTETGVEIEVRLPGRRTQGLSLLSGGERSLTAIALIFSLLKVSPTPFCLLDEVDAMLDEANVGRYCELLGELSLNTQFVIVTHNRNTVQVADYIYGVTLGRDLASQVLSLKADEINRVIGEED